MIFSHLFDGAEEVLMAPLCMFCAIYVFVALSWGAQWVYSCHKTRIDILNSIVPSDGSRMTSIALQSPSHTIPNQLFVSRSPTSQFSSSLSTRNTENSSVVHSQPLPFPIATQQFSGSRREDLLNLAQLYRRATVTPSPVQIPLTDQSPRMIHVNIEGRTTSHHGEVLWNIVQPAHNPSSNRIDATSGIFLSESTASTITFMLRNTPYLHYVGTSFVLAKFTILLAEVLALTYLSSHKTVSNSQFSIPPILVSAINLIPDMLCFRIIGAGSYGSYVMISKCV
jgi:hypothetical protein